MDDLNEVFNDYFSDSFYEYIGKIFLELEKKDENYKNLCEKEELILQEYPKIREFFENNKNVSMSIEEIQAVKSILKIREDKRIKEEKAIFIKGMSTLFHLFKTLNYFEEL